MRGVLVLLCLIIACMVVILVKKDSSLSNNDSTLVWQMKFVRDKVPRVHNDNRKSQGLYAELEPLKIGIAFSTYLLKLEDVFIGGDSVEVQDALCTNFCNQYPNCVTVEHQVLKMFKGFQVISGNSGSEVAGSAFTGQMQSPANCGCELVAYGQCAGKGNKVLSLGVRNRGKEPSVRGESVSCNKIASTLGQMTSIFGSIPRMKKSKAGDPESINNGEDKDIQEAAKGSLTNKE